MHQLLHAHSMSATSLQNRDWRQARKRTAEGRFASDDALGDASTAAEAIERAAARQQPASAAPAEHGRVAAPKRLLGRLTGVQHGLEHIEDGQVPDARQGSSHVAVDRAPGALDSPETA